MQASMIDNFEAKQCLILFFTFVCYCFQFISYLYEFLTAPQNVEKVSKTFQKLKARQLEKTEQTNIIQNCETFRAIEPEVDTY